MQPITDEQWVKVEKVLSNVKDFDTPVEAAMKRIAQIMEWERVASND